MPLFPGSVWTDEVGCTVVNATVTWDVNCSYSCGAECRRGSRYPCLQVYVSLNASGKVVRLLHNEDTQDSNPEVRARLGVGRVQTRSSFFFFSPSVLLRPQVS